MKAAIRSLLAEIVPAWFRHREAKTPDAAQGRGSANSVKMRQQVQEQTPPTKTEQPTPTSRNGGGDD